MDPVLEKTKEHLITKNVAMEISERLCESVAAKLEGKVIGTFRGIQSTVRASMEESLEQILSPKCRVDILRDVMDARSAGQPYTITFCGVNGVGKSTNLANVHVRCPRETEPDRMYAWGSVVWCGHSCSIICSDCENYCLVLVINQKLFL